MPVTPFQAAVLRALAPNRSPESFVAGGIALNAHEGVRWSADVDVFHDAEDAVIRSSEAGVKLEWCHDAAWRFFPIETDELLGWRLHWFDAITNKALAMGSRAETRDLVDIVAYADRCPLHAVIWAACSKDPGFGPLLLLSQMRRHSRVNVAELREMGAAVDATALKLRWIEIADTADAELTRAGTTGVEVGLAFMQPNGSIGWFDDPGVVPHRATLGGAAPRLVE